MGKQPCQYYNPHLEANEYAIWNNVHSCYCKDKNGEYCKKTVSFCDACHNDHHEDGYENCVCANTKEPK